MGLLLIDTIAKNKSIFNPSPDLDSSKYGIWDLTKASITYDNVNVKISEVFIVGDDYQMRPDLIAAIKFGDQGRMGSLLKLNNISNPFAIDQNRVLMLPTSSTIDSTFNVKKAKNQSINSSNTSTNANQVFRNNQEQKKFKISDGRKKFLDTRIKNTPEMALPPHVMQPSQRTILKKDGFIIFAPDSGGGGLTQPAN
jgi:hypothetical protein